MVWIKREIRLPAPESFGVVEGWHRKFNEYLTTEYQTKCSWGIFESRSWLVNEGIDIMTFLVTHNKTGESYVLKELCDAKYGPDGNTLVRDDYLIEFFSSNPNTSQLEMRVQELKTALKNAEERK
ncbi:hypothetical protein HY450_03520 [Candidatus Pacearchaeota archaeon]|nr:hypothetical protein [Candidatus Pacearchaeota archaeon]